MHRLIICEKDRNRLLQIGSENDCRHSWKQAVHQLFCEFKAAAVSCKVHKTIYKPEEEHQIVSNIAGADYCRGAMVKEELCRHRRGPAATGRKACFRDGWYLSQLRQKAAFLYGKRPETQSEILETLEVVDLKLSFAPYGRWPILRSFTPTIAKSLIERIEVHNNDKYDSYCHARADIYFTGVGILDSPVKKESLDMYERSPG